MKLSSILYVFTIIAGVAVTAHSEYDELEAREWLDEFSVRDVLLDHQVRSDTIEALTTRELVDELQSRLERRGHGSSKLSKPPPYVCPYCGSKYKTAREAKDCSLFCKAKR